MLIQLYRIQLDTLYRFPLLQEDMQDCFNIIWDQAKGRHGQPP